MSIKKCRGNPHSLTALIVHHPFVSTRSIPTIGAGTPNAARPSSVWGLGRVSAAKKRRRLG